MVRSTRQLESLRDEWDALATPFATPLLDHDWFLACATSLYQDCDLRVLTIRDARGLVAAAPLAEERTDGGRRIVLLGVSRLYEPSGWLHSSDEALGSLIEKALGLRQPMLLQRLPEGSRACDALSTLPRTRGLTVARRTAASLEVPIAGTWDEYYASRSSQITRNLPRLRRKAERAHGPMKVVRRSPSITEVEDSLETLMTVEGSGWKGRGGSSLAARSDLQGFFRHYCRLAAMRGRLRVTTLLFGSKVAAVELGVEAYDRFWQLKIGYHDGMASFYPGLHLTEASIHAAFDCGLKSYEFLGSAAAWEERWGTRPRHYRTVLIYPLSPTGVFIATRDAARIIMGRLQNRERRAPLEPQPGRGLG